ncbi:MAG: efflux RND transporter periplasmic adaptor subunit [Pseudomonadota bacterium]
MKAYLLVIVLLLAIFGAIGGYQYQRMSAFAAMDFSPPPVTIAAARARLEQWDTVLNAVGTIEAVRGIELTSETSGEITAIQFDSGDQVRSGDTLVVLNDEVERASRRNQQATLELAEILFERDEALAAKGSIPATQLDRSRADLSRSRAQLAETNARLENKTIAAPFSGTMGIRRVDVGDYLSPGTVIATLQDTSELEIDFTLPARHAPDLAPGLQVSVKVDAFPERTFAAVIRAVDARVDPNTRNVLVRASLAEANGLLPGMFAVLEIGLDRDSAVVTIPETALTYSLQGNTVFVIENVEDSEALTATARVVEAGAVRNGRVAIPRGLQDGDRVVSVGQNKLYRGVRVLIDENIQL